MLLEGAIAFRFFINLVSRVFFEAPWWAILSDSALNAPTQSGIGFRLFARVAAFFHGFEII